MISQGSLGLSNNQYDEIVVGGGPVGISLALELAERGRRVLLLESGGDAHSNRSQQLSNADYVDQHRHDAMEIAIARRLGGTSNLWGGRCVPYDRIDFASRRDLVDASWPIGYDDIEPFYAQACRYANCGAPVFEAPPLAAAAPHGAFVCDRLERWSNRPRFQDAHRKVLADSHLIDVRLGCTVVDLHFDAGRIEAIGVRTSDGSAHKVGVSRLVLSAGGVETTRLLLAVQHQAPAMFGGVGGPLGRYYMGHVIGEIADIIFADKATEAAFDFYVDENGSYVRRRMVPSAALQGSERLTNIAFWPVVPPSADPRHGSGILSLVALVMSFGPLGRLLVAEAIRRRHVPERIPRLRHVGNVLRDLPRSSVAALELIWRRYATNNRHPGFFVRNRAMRYGLSYHAEHLPDAESRVQLGRGADRLGLRRVEIDLRFSEEDAAAVVRSHDALARWLVATGLGRLEYRFPREHLLSAVLEQASHGTHQIGLCRMGATAQEGVVDRNLKCFGTENLYVASTGVLPTSGQANPTLTAIALAVRLARHLA